MNVTMKKTAAAVVVALMLSGCKISGSSGSHTPQPIEPAPTVKAIDYSEQSVQQLEQSVIKAQKVLMESQTKLTQVETKITEINRRIIVLNEEIRVLEKAEKNDVNALKTKRDALAEAKQLLIVQNKILVVVQQDVKQAQINVMNVQNILIEKKAEQNNPSVIVTPGKPSKPNQSNQSSQSNQPTQPSQPSNASQPNQPSQPGSTLLSQSGGASQPNKPGSVSPSQSGNASQQVQPTPQPGTEKPEVNLEGVAWRNWDAVGTERFYTSIAKYATDYDGPRGDLVLSDQNTAYFRDLDFYQIAKQDKNNPNFYGWHEGSIENEGIEGIEIKSFELAGDMSPRNILTQAVRPERFNYIFKNTPYSTYGALFTNEHDVMMFTTRGSSAVVGETNNAYSIGKYRINDKGIKTDRIDFIDEVKGSATYKGEVLARTGELLSNKGVPSEYRRSLPFKDGNITINAHFGERPENSFITATLKSKTLGEQQFEKSRMTISDKRDIEFYRTNSTGVILDGLFIGQHADEAVGTIRYDSGAVDQGNGNYRYSSYNAVFSAEKQPK